MNNSYNALMFDWDILEDIDYLDICGDTSGKIEMDLFALGECEFPLFFNPYYENTHLGEEKMENMRNCPHCRIIPERDSFLIEDHVEGPFIQVFCENCGLAGPIAND